MLLIQMGRDGFFLNQMGEENMFPIDEMVVWNALRFALLSTARIVCNIREHENNGRMMIPIHL